MLEKVIDGQLPNEIAAMYDGYLITQGMQEHPQMATAPSVNPPNVVICDGEQYGVFDLTSFESVTELKEWLEDLDLTAKVESVRDDILQGSHTAPSLAGNSTIDLSQAVPEHNDAEGDNEVAQALVRVSVLEEKKAKHLEELSVLPDEEVKDIQLQRLGETEYQLRQAKQKVSMLESNYRYKMNGANDK